MNNIVVITVGYIQYRLCVRDSIVSGAYMGQIIPQATVLGNFLLTEYLSVYKKG